MSNYRTTEELLESTGWRTEAVINVPGRDAKYATLDPERVAQITAGVASDHYPNGIYSHQKVAVERFAQGENVCLTTGTASGKTTLFHLAAIEILAHDPAARILCLYPLRALASEQEQRWKRLLEPLTKERCVGRIAGDVPVKSRADLIKRTRVLVATPDVVHAWLLPNCGDKAVRGFLKQLRLVVVDEAHAYSGVFGSNAAYLFRRLRHICSLLGNEPKFVSASATIARPFEHLQNLIGVDFSIVGEEHDGARRFPIDIRLVHPPQEGDFLTSFPKLITNLASAERRLIAFVDSRKQVELLTSIAARENALVAEDPSDDVIASPGLEPDEEDFDIPAFEFDYLKKLSILPYRSGYEEADRAMIQRRLQAGDLSGVISTSALELGIDIPHLDTGLLVGVPASSTSLYQRIGRVGRHKHGEVLIINTGSIYDEAVFANPDSLLTRPPIEGALYLENRRIQYIHAMCLARLRGEHDAAVRPAADDFAFRSSIGFPPGFLQLCESERTGQIDAELQAMKGEAGDSPNLVFPLRDVETQFKIIFKKGPDVRSLGQASYSQVLREAYPGAVYRYATQAYRVYSVGLQSKEIKVRAERSFITKPTALPTLVFPNLTAGNIHRELEVSDIVFAEANLQVRESNDGFTERRGQTEIKQKYPLANTAASLYYTHDTFFRNYFTSGVLIFHPGLDREGVNRDGIRKLLFEAFLMVVPFDRSDIGSACDKLRTSWRNLESGRRFISIFDSTYGSLRVTGRLLDEDVVVKALLLLRDLAEIQQVDASTLSIIKSMADCATMPFSYKDVRLSSSAVTEDGYTTVVRPGSVGMHVGSPNEEIEIVKVYWNAKEGRLFYKGIRETERADNTLLTPVANVVPIPGKSELSLYNLETGELEDLPS